MSCGASGWLGRTRAAGRSAHRGDRRRDGPLECAYAGGKRFTLQPRLAPIAPAASDSLDQSRRLSDYGRRPRHHCRDRAPFRAHDQTHPGHRRQISAAAGGEPRIPPASKTPQQLAAGHAPLHSNRAGTGDSPSDVEARLLRVACTTARSNATSPRPSAQPGHGEYAASMCATMPPFGALIDRIYATLWPPGCFYSWGGRHRRQAAPGQNAPIPSIACCIPRPTARSCSLRSLRMKI